MLNISELGEVSAARVGELLSLSKEALLAAGDVGSLFAGDDVGTGEGRGLGTWASSEPPVLGIILLRPLDVCGWL